MNGSTELSLQNITEGLVNLLGRWEDDPAFTEIVSLIPEMPTFDRSAGMCEVHFGEAGFSLISRDRIFFALRIMEGFKGSLPCAIAFGDNRDNVRRKMESDPVPWNVDTYEIPPLAMRLFFDNEQRMKGLVVIWEHHFPRHALSPPKHPRLRN